MLSLSSFSVSLALCLSVCHSVCARTHLHMNAVIEMRLDLVMRVQKNYYECEGNKTVRLVVEHG